MLVEIDLWDVADNNRFVSIRSLCYTGASIVLLFFRVTRPDSYESLRSKWAIEVALHCASVPWVVVATHAGDRGKAQVMLQSPESCVMVTLLSVEFVRTVI